MAYQAPSFMRFSRQAYWGGLPFPSPGDLPDPRIEPGSLGFTLDGFIYCSIFMQDFSLERLASLISLDLKDWRRLISAFQRC